MFNFYYYFFYLRKISLPYVHFSLLKRSTSLEELHVLRNVVTLTIEDCYVNDQHLQIIRFCSPTLKNLNVRRSSIIGTTMMENSLPEVPLHVRNPRQSLKTLDISEMTSYTPTLVKNWVLDDNLCKITHLYVERCNKNIPRCVSSDHLRIEFISFAGYRPYDSVEFGQKVFEDIDSWTGISSMKAINASACNMNEMQHDELMRKHPNVVFDFSVQFKQSPRVEF
jgi:hypothetical protein